MLAKLLYVFGTNGAGKTTLARAMIEHAGGIVSYKGKLTDTRSNLSLVGPYHTQAAGLDTIGTYENLNLILNRADPKKVILVEGLVRYSIEHYQELKARFKQHTFIYLTTSLEDCIANVRKRRNIVGSFKTTNIQGKFMSTRSLAKSMDEAGLNIKRLNYDKALALCREYVQPVEYVPEPKQSGFLRR